VGSRQVSNSRKAPEMDGRFPVEWTRFGFHWGPAVIERVAIGPRGHVALYIGGTDGEKATGRGLVVTVSPKGHRIYVDDWSEA
jgi:hypothetical protein